MPVGDFVGSGGLVLAGARGKMVQHHVAPFLGADHDGVFFLDCADIGFVVAWTWRF
jgi:hypothetical protein